VDAQYFAELAEKQEACGLQKVEVPDDRFTCFLHKRPLGVAALITPFNYPLLMATWKVAPCLAAGCCAVLKPSEQASVTCQMLGDIAAEAGIPHGVLSILTGDGPTTGAPLTVHPGIDKISFTGSMATGVRVMKAAADRVVPVTLELGGKSPLVVFADACGSEADIDKAAEWAMFGCMWTNGQICSATSRLLLQRSVADAFLARLKHHCAAVVVGDPLERATRLGPIVSAQQYTKVMAHIQTAVAEGATLLTGGAHPGGERCSRGYFVEPTVLVGVTPSMRIFREEVFGPVLAVTLFDTEEEALALAGDTDFGLGAAVITTDPQRCDRMALAFHAGIVWQNCSQPCFCHAPWGGFKRSGFGRELGPNGLDGYQGVKQVTKYTSADQFCWYPSFKKE
jgi:betaine-aldehyde dehydrogenase